MIVEINSGKAGFKEYLEHGKKQGRELHRDQLDQRIPLFGDLSVFELATSVHEGEGHKYDHITLSFSEHHVSDDMLQRAVDEFRDHVLAAWPESKRDRIAFYAEAHRPRILSYTSSETGQEIERLTHIHIGIGKRDLLTGKFVEPMGYLGPHSSNLQYIDAWQESFNARYGFGSPKDNPKITPENAVDVLARYTGQKPNPLGNFNNKKADVEITLQKEILRRNVTTWQGFGQLLAEFGEVSKMRMGQFNESYTLKLRGQNRAMRLKGVSFQREFIERPTAQKLAIFERKAKMAYLEQMQPKKSPEYVAAVLHEWHQYKARERRFFHPNSKFYRQSYKPADAAERLRILQNLEKEHDGITRPLTNQVGKTTPARNRLPAMPVRDLDGIQRRTEMLLRDHTGMDVRAELGPAQVGAGLRQADGGAGRTRAGSLEAPQRLIQASSMLGRIQTEMRERYELASDKQRYAEIRKHLDCAQLLSALSHSHGLNPALYQVQVAADGSPRIQCGSRALSPSDFLTKELGLPWRESAPILRRVYEHQIGMKSLTARGRAAGGPLWQAFKAQQLADKPALTARLKVFDADTKLQRAALLTALQSDQATTLAGLTGADKKAAQSLAKFRAATAKLEFTESRREARKTIPPIQAEAWQQFLLARAQAGNEEALAALRQLDDTPRITPRNAITGTLHLEDDEELLRLRRSRLSALLRALNHTVEHNGDITYRQAGAAVLRDEGQHLAVLDQHSEDAIAAGLLLGREKFGAQLTLTGSPEFQQRVVDVAVARGIQVTFLDPQLEALRLQKASEKHQVVLTPAPRKPKAVKAVEIPAGESHQVEPVPSPAAIPQTAAEWVASQAKPLGDAYLVESAGTRFRVAHVAPDGVVLDHGRTMAVYPVSPDLVLQAGDQVEIGRGLALRLPIAPEQGLDQKDPGR